MTENPAVRPPSNKISYNETFMMTCYNEILTTKPSAIKHRYDNPAPLRDKIFAKTDILWLNA